MQFKSSQIKKLMMHNDFICKNLYSVERTKLSSTSVVVLMYTCANTLIFLVSKIGKAKTLLYRNFGWCLYIKCFLKGLYFSKHFSVCDSFLEPLATLTTLIHMPNKTFFRLFCLSVCLLGIRRIVTVVLDATWSTVYCYQDTQRN